MKRVKITKEQRKILENNVIAFATTDHFCAPNVTLIKGVKVISDNEILITDSCIKNLKESLSEDPRAALLVWQLDEKLEYQFKGDTKFRDEECSSIILKVVQIWDMLNLDLIAGKSNDK